MGVLADRIAGLADRIAGCSRCIRSPLPVFSIRMEQFRVRSQNFIVAGATVGTQTNGCPATKERAMSPRFGFLPTGLEEAQFKRDADGWLFTTANPWIL